VADTRPWARISDRDQGLDSTLVEDAADHWAEIAREDREKTRPRSDDDGGERLDDETLQAIFDGVECAIGAPRVAPGRLALAVLGVLHAVLCAHEASPDDLAMIGGHLSGPRDLLASLGTGFPGALEALLRVARPGLRSSGRQGDERVGAASAARRQGR